MAVIKKGEIELSIGKAVGHVLEDELIGTKERMWIISPWISKEYAKLLLEKKEKGIDVKLITTDDIHNTSHTEALETLIEKTKVPLYPSLANSLYMKILSILGILFGLLFLIISPVIGIILMLVCIIFSFMTFSTKTTYTPKIPLTILAKKGYDDFTHSKIYLLDKKAIVGSANLTKSGLWKNWESIVIIKDEKLVEDIARVFETLEKHPLKEIRTIEEIGKEIYSSIAHKKYY